MMIFSVRNSVSWNVTKQHFYSPWAKLSIRQSSSLLYVTALYHWGMRQICVWAIELLWSEHCVMLCCCCLFFQCVPHLSLSLMFEVPCFLVLILACFLNFFWPTIIHDYGCLLVHWPPTRMSTGFALLNITHSFLRLTPTHYRRHFNWLHC